MRGKMLAIAVLMGMGGTASAQSFGPGGCNLPTDGWRQVRSRWIDVNCTPTRIVYMAPRQNYPQVYPIYQPIPVPIYQPIPVPVFQPVAAAPQPVFAGVNFQAPAAVAPPPAPPVAPPPAVEEKAKLVFTTPVPKQPIGSKATTAESPDEEAARKLKLARYLEADGLTAKARERYQDIVNRFPETAAAEEARQLLSNGG